MSIIITFKQDSQRFDRWVKKEYPRVAYGELQRWIRTGQIRVNKKRIKTSFQLSKGDEVRFPPQFQNLQKNFDFDNKPTGNKKTRTLLQNSIIYEDETCIILNKPQGLAVQGGTNLRDYIDLYLANLLEGQEDILRITHRLDKDTAGLLILAKTQDAARYYTKAFQSRTIQKTYHAVIVGRPKISAGTIDMPIGKMMGAEKELMSGNAPHVDSAMTDYKTLHFDSRLNLSLLKLTPHSGRTHQIRVHLFEGLGRPILGDGKYGGKEAHPDIDLEDLPLCINRLTMNLAATGLVFDNPDGKPLRLQIPLPDFFVIQ